MTKKRFCHLKISSTQEPQSGTTFLGNHEFDDGVGNLSAFTNAITDNYPMLACNINVSRVPELKNLIKPYILKTFNGETVAIVGKDTYRMIRTTFFIDHCV